MYDVPVSTRTALPDPCPGPCSAHWRQAEAQRLSKGTPHDLTPRAGQPVWCQPCAVRLRSQTAAFPDLASRLQLEIENGSSVSIVHVSGSRERPIHQHQAAAFLIDDIAGVLTDWATVVREDRGLATARPGRPRGTVITDDTRLLLRHLDWLIGEHPVREASVAFGEEVGRIHRRASKLTKTDDVRPERLDGIPCSRCDLKTLERELDWQGRATGYVICRSCEVLLNAAEYERWTKLAAQPLKKLVST